MASEYPRISVVTACYNAAEYIESTLLSVLSQNYPNLEYIVIDGGSTDGTVQIIERYRDKLAFFVSETDNGQYYGIQKGLDKATGDVVCWLNADDIYMPWTLSVVGEIFYTLPKVNWITGLPAFLNRRGQMNMVYGTPAAYPQSFIARGLYNRNLGGFLQQESMFWRRDLFLHANGTLDLSLSFAADYELWTRLAKFDELCPVNIPLAAFRKLPGEQRSSVGATQYDHEVKKVMERQTGNPKVWQAISNRGGIIVRSLIRLIITRRAPVILFNESRDCWCRIETRRSISRLGLSDLKQQFSLRRYEE